MPRLLRLHVVGGYYHVMLRGNHRQDLFATAADRCVLNDILGEVLERCGARAHAFCWMTNYMHLLVQIGDRPLGGIMQRVAMRYSCPLTVPGRGIGGNDGEGACCWYRTCADTAVCTEDWAE